MFSFCYNFLLRQWMFNEEYYLPVILISFTKKKKKRKVWNKRRRNSCCLALQERLEKNEREIVNDECFLFVPIWWHSHYVKKMDRKNSAIMTNKVPVKWFVMMFIPLGNCEHDENQIKNDSPTQENINIVSSIITFTHLIEGDVHV